MLSKFEIIGIGISVIFMALALYLVRIETSFLGFNSAGTQLASAPKSNSSVVVVSDGDETQARTEALEEALDQRGNLKNMVIDDIVVGEGDEAKIGDTVEVHYIGTLQDGQEFDASRKRGETFSFTLGEGKVIAGWEQGLLGMREGGKRILVIPAHLAYGDRAIGVIPAGATLIFSIELISVVNPS
jgi:FKBP-type peptidyl-prolyl cis-trans isomerase